MRSTKKFLFSLSVFTKVSISQEELPIIKSHDEDVWNETQEE